MAAADGAALRLTLLIDQLRELPAARGLDQWVCCFSVDGGILIQNTTFVQREFKESLKPAKIGRLLTTEACAGQRRSDEPDVPAATVTPRPRRCIRCQTRLGRQSQRRFEASENARGTLRRRDRAATLTGLPGAFQPKSF